MQVPDWNFDQDRDFPLKYNLTDTDREYLQTKRKSDHPDDPEDRISDKVNNLPERIQDLLIDITMLEADERLTEETWKNLLRISRSEYRIDTLDETDLEVEELYKPTTAFGHQLGTVLQYLYEPVEIDWKDEMQEYNPPLEEDSELQWEDIIWGIILAFLENEGQKIEKTRKSFEDFDTFLNDRMQKRMETVSVDRDDAFEQERVDNQTKLKEKISESIVDHDLEPTPGALSVLQNQIPESPMQDLEKFNHLFEELLDKTPFEDINKIESDAKKDIKNIKQKKIQGINAENLLRNIIGEVSNRISYTTDRSISEDDFVKKFSNESQKNTTQALRALGKQYDSYLWPEYKIVEETGERWTLTNYGNLIAYSYFNKKGRTLWMYDPYVHADKGMKELEDVVIPALEEVFDDYYDPYWAYFYNS